MEVQVPCIPIDANRSMLGIVQRDLLKIAQDPVFLCSNLKRDLGLMEPEDMDARGLHHEIQRRKSAGKKSNVRYYVVYLEDIYLGGREGFAPPISLFSEQVFPYIADGGGRWSPGEPCKIVIPFGINLVAFDGDTQLAARHILCRDHPKLLDEVVSVTLIHGLSRGWAQQAFHDVNTYGVKVERKLALAMDHSDPIVNCAKRLMKIQGFTGERDEPSLSTLRCATKAFFGGYSRASTNEPFRSGDVKPHMALFDRWFDAVFKLFEGRSTEDKFGVARAQVVMVALGSLGHLVQFKNDRDFAAAIDSIRDVNWDTGGHWIGLACKVSARKQDQGAIILDSGTHANWRGTFEAISNSDSPLYRQIRIPHATKRAS